MSALRAAPAPGVAAGRPLPKGVAHARRPFAARIGAVPGAVILTLGVAFAAALLFDPFVTPDTVYGLIWGRELLQGDLESFAPGPTPHPLTVGLGAAASLLGSEGGYVATFLLFGPVSLGALAGGVFAVAQRVGSAWSGLLASTIVLTSGSILNWAAVARYDVAFAALLMWSLALAVVRPRRDATPLWLLAVAGLIRPEAWALAGAYWIWIAPAASTRKRLGSGALVLAAPAIWIAMDASVTGDPLYSLHYTQDAAEGLYGRFSHEDNLSHGYRTLAGSVGACALLLAPLSLLRRRDVDPRGMAWAWLLLVATAAAFVALALGGLAASERYLLVPACVIAVLAGIAATPPRSRRASRRTWLLIASALVLLQGVARWDDASAVRAGVAPAVVRVDDLKQLLAMPAVARAVDGCGEAATSRRLVHDWAYFSGRTPAAWTFDERGTSRPDVYVAPSSPAAAEQLLTRARFDAHAGFRLPPGMRAGPRLGDWQIHFAPGSRCAGSLARRA